MRRAVVGLLFCLTPFFVSLADAPEGVQIRFGISGARAQLVYGVVSDSEYPVPGEASCSTWTAATKGDATIACAEIAETTVTLTCSGTNDQGNICYAYRTATDASDLQIEAVVPAEWTGHLENFTSFGVFVAEGTGDDDYSFQVFWPNIGTMRSKVWNGTAVQQNGASGQFLPRRPVATYDLSATDLQGWECDDTDCFAIGTATDKTLTFPVIYGVFGTSHDSAATTTAALTGIAFSTTIDVVDEEPPPPTGNDHVVDSDAEFDCIDEGVEPGDTVTIPGGTRGSILFDRCVGDATADITIRHDSTDNERAVISGTGTGDVFVIRNSEYLTVDGTAGWVGGPTGTCSGHTEANWPVRGTTDNCGILVKRASGDQAWFIKHRGRARNITIKGVECDGSGDPGGAGVCYSTNDNSYTKSENPGEWRENFLLEDVYFHNARTEGMYFGTNRSQTDAMEVRNVEIRYSYLHTCGAECINGKSWEDGTNVVHHVEVHDSGFTMPNLGPHGIQIIGTSDIHDTLVYNVNGNCLHSLAIVPSSFGDQTIRLYNNVVYDCALGGPFIDGLEVYSIQVGGSNEAGTADVNTIVYSNTAVGEAIRMNASAEQGTACNNLVAADVVGPIISPSSFTRLNNHSGSIASMQFTDSANDDYSLTEDSPAVDAGTTGADCMPSTDFIGTARPQNSIPDQGAYEHVP